MSKDDWFAWYKTYLKSNHWKRTRARTLWRDNFICQVRRCKTTNTLQVHHLRYTRVSPIRLWLCEITGWDIFGEWPRDLKTVCTYHHDLITSKQITPQWKGWLER